MFFKHWMKGIRRNFHQRFQHKSARLHGGMGDLQTGFIHYAITVQQNVDIDCAGAFVS